MTRPSGRAPSPKEPHAGSEPPQRRAVCSLLQWSRKQIAINLSVLDDLLFVPVGVPPAPQDIALPGVWDAVTALAEEITAARLAHNADGLFRAVPPGIYGMISASYGMISAS